MRPVLPLLIFLFGAIFPSSLAARSLLIEDLDSEIRVLPNGEIEVTETIRVRFEGAWNGIFRNLSLRHRTAEGDSERLDVELHSVTDAEGNPLEYEINRPDGWTRQFKIWVPGAEDTTRTVVLRYTVDHALRFFDAESETGALDELYWQVTGTEWEMPIERARARVVLPEGVEATQAAAYTGRAESTAQNANVEIDRNVVTVPNAGPFAVGEGLTVAVGWAPGVVQRPTAAEGAIAAVQENWPLGIPVLVFLFGFTTWRRKGRDPEKREITVQYEPPEGMSPAELGTLIDHKAEMHDITATLVDLAVRGYVVIEEREEEKLFGLMSDKEYLFHLRKPRSEWDGLAPHERSFLSALFKDSSDNIGKATARWAEKLARRSEEPKGEGLSDPDRDEFRSPLDSAYIDSTKLSDLKDSFYEELPGIRDGIYGELMRRGFYRERPDQVKGRWIGGAVVFGMAAIFGAAWIAENHFLGLSPVAVAVAGGSSALVLLVFGLLMPARTSQGARAMEEALGFREFLDKVETDRFRRMITSPEMFERFLPHAMAFQVEDRWAKAFEDLHSEPPDWYRGASHGSFRASTFTSDLSGLSQEAGSTMASSPSSSGSGGGGSVGGGSGGGGGGGF